MPETAMRAQVSSRVVCRRLDWELGAADVLRLLRADSYPAALLGAWPAAATSSPPTRCGCVRSSTQRIRVI